MTINELTAEWTPAERGIIAAIIDMTEGLSDDCACDEIHREIYRNDDLDATRNLGFNAAGRFAYKIVFDCKLTWN
jgi:hypothetical protein